MFASKETPRSLGVKDGARGKKNRGRRREEEGLLHRAAARSRRRELKIVSDYERRGIDCHSVYRVEGKRKEREERKREGEKAKEKKSKRAASFKSGMESSNSRSRYVPFRPIS